jgi:hypothetical protein
MPFNAPSPVLFQLLGWITDAAKGVVSTASEKIADATSNTPVGTVQALIEQGAVIFSSIHARLHFSQAKKFEIVLRILKQYFPQKLQAYGLNPEVVTMRGVHPVSDPRVFSEAQRFAQAQGVLQMAEKAGQDPRIKYDMYELHRSVLSLMKVQNIDKILPPPQKSEPADPAGELVAMINGKPVITVPQMDHAAHIQTHVAYLKNPLLGGNPIMVPITAKVLEHLKEHLGHFFAMRMQMAAQQMMPQSPEQGMMPQQGQQPQPEQLMAQASEELVQQDMQVASEILPIIQEAEEFVRSTMMQANPDMAMVKVQADGQQKALEMQYEKQNNDLQIKLMQQEQRVERANFEMMLEARKQENKELVEQIKIEQKESSDALAQQVELMKNDVSNQQKQTTELLKNFDDNQTQLMIAQMKQEIEALKVERELNAADYMGNVGKITGE